MGDLGSGLAKKQYIAVASVIYVTFIPLIRLDKMVVQTLCSSVSSGIESKGPQSFKNESAAVETVVLRTGSVAGPDVRTTDKVLQVIG